MGESRESDDELWPRGWEGHERDQLRRSAQIPFPVKLQWLEDMHRMVRHMEQQRQERKTKDMSEGTQTPQQPSHDISQEQRQRIEAALRASPSQMTLQLARQLGVPEAEVIRALPDGRAVELDVGRWEELIQALEGLGTVHVIVSNGSVTCEVNGQFRGFSTWGEFFNVQSKSLDMHIRHAELAAAFAVEKPGHMDGVNTLSVQFYGRGGAAAFKVFLTFGGRKPEPERYALFDSLRERFRKRGCVP